MQKDNEELKKILDEDLSKFEGFIQETQKHKVKMLNPKISANVIASVSVVAYIKALKERIGL